MEKLITKLKNINPALKWVLMTVGVYLIIQVFGWAFPETVFAKLASGLQNIKSAIFSMQAFQLILSLSILVVLHELGHFIPARLFKTRVEKFYLFFDPYFSVFKKKIGETEYGIGWLPLGGYVKISGMIDESMDKEQMKKPAENWEFRAKPAWQRLIIMLGGVTVNFILAIFVFSLVLFNWGETYVSNHDVVDGVVCSEFIKQYGFQNGDKIVSVKGDKIVRFRDIQGKMIMNDESFKVVVNRGGEDTTIVVPDGFITDFKNSDKQIMFSPRKKLRVESVVVGSSADRAGLKKGDIIYAVDSVSNIVTYQDELSLVLSGLLDNKISQTTIYVKRDGFDRELQCELNNDGTLGFYALGTTTTTKNYGLLESFGSGYKLTVSHLKDYVKGIQMLMKPKNELGDQLGGFGAIGNMFGDQWNWHSFWYMTALLSLILAFMNLLPIPALDGGHVMFLIYEIIARKPVPDKVLEYAQMIGMIILLSLLVFANGNDILKAFN